jgi:hypothetical protein
MSTRRFEFKYILDPAKRMRAEHYVRKFMRLDPSAGAQGTYMVSSIYFETPGLKDYYEKSGGFLERKKLRARVYEKSHEGKTPVRLEIKNKYDMAFKKELVIISAGDWDDILNRRYARLLSRARSPKDTHVLNRFVLFLLEEGRSPAYFIRYKRTPYVLGNKKDSSYIRITFDEHIEGARHNSLVAPKHLSTTSNLAVLEVKFCKELPVWFGVMIRDLNLERTSFSKYSRSVDATQRYNPLPR